MGVCSTGWSFVGACYMEGVWVKGVSLGGVSLRCPACPWWSGGFWCERLCGVVHLVSVLCLCLSVACPCFAARVCPWAVPWQMAVAVRSTAKDCAELLALFPSDSFAVVCQRSVEELFLKQENIYSVHSLEPTQSMRSVLITNETGLPVSRVTDERTKRKELCINLCESFSCNTFVKKIK